MKNLLSTLALALIAVTGFAQKPTTWDLDASHSNVRFTVAHMVVADVDGNFKKFDGKVVSSKPDLTDASVNFTVEVASIDTDNDNRDGHLKGDDFFNAEKYPQMKFKSTSFKKVKGNKYVLEGDLTIRDVTKRVKFDVTYGGQMKDPYGNMKAGFKATSVINRQDYKLSWSKTNEAGELVVGNDVTISLNLEFGHKA